MGLNSNSHVLSKGLIMIGVLRGWVADNKDTDEEAAEHENQSHPQHPPSPCKIHVKIWTSKSCPSISAHPVFRSRMKHVHYPPDLPLPCLQIWNNENTSFVYGQEMFHPWYPWLVSCHWKFSQMHFRVFSASRRLGEDQFQNCSFMLFTKYVFHSFTIHPILSYWRLCINIWSWCLWTQTDKG